MDSENQPAVNTPSDEKTRNLAIEVTRLASDRHCTDLVILDLQESSPIARYFVIGTGTSDQQIKSVASEIETVGKHQGSPAYSKAGMQNGRWVIVDFVDIVVHLFDKEYRQFYDLELLWGDAPRVDWVRE